MKRMPAKMIMTFAAMLMAILGFQANASATELPTASPAVFSAELPQSFTDQDIFNKYVQPVHRRCSWRVRWKRVCVGGWDGYGNCYRWGQKKIRWCKKIWHKHRKKRGSYY